MITWFDQQGRGFLMSGSRLLPLSIVAALPIYSSAATAQSFTTDVTAQACFEIITQQKAEPRSPLLLDRCRGRTWILVRVSGEFRGRMLAPTTFRWLPLIVDEPDREEREHPVAAPVPSRVDGLGGHFRCFEFS